MSKWRPSKCRYCGITKSAGAYISKRGLCATCAVKRMAAALDGAKAGADQAVTDARRVDTPGG